MFALAALLSTPAAAGPARTLDGARVDTSDYTVIAFSLDDPDSLRKLRYLDGVPGVLAVNTDAAAAGSQVRHFLRGEEIGLPVVCDPAQRIESREFATDQEIAQLIRASTSRVAVLD